MNHHFQSRGSAKGSSNSMIPRDAHVQGQHGSFCKTKHIITRLLLDTRSCTTHRTAPCTEYVCMYYPRRTRKLVTMGNAKSPMYSSLAYTARRRRYRRWNKSCDSILCSRSYIHTVATNAHVRRLIFVHPATRNPKRPPKMVFVANHLLDDGLGRVFGGTAGIRNARGLRERSGLRQPPEPLYESDHRFRERQESWGKGKLL